LLATEIHRLEARLWRLVRPEGPRPRPRNVLCLELSEMGSVVLADPALRRLRDGLGARVHFAIFARNRESLKICGTVDEADVFTVREGSLFSLALDTVRLLRWARARNIDTVIDMELFSRYAALLTGLCGAANRVGFHAFHNEGLYRGEMLTHRVWCNPHIHIAKNYLALVEALASAEAQVPYAKVAIPDSAIELLRPEIPEAARREMLDRVRALGPPFEPEPGKIALMNPNAGDLLPIRRWEPANFRAVIRNLLDEFPDRLVLVTGSASERPQAQALCDAVADPRCLNFAGQCRLAELPALYSLCRLMLTNDSGPAHFASVTEMRVFVLFGPETPKLYGPLGNGRALFAGLACSPCVSAANHRKSPCTDNKCLQALTPERVWDALRPSLAGDE